MRAVESLTAIRILIGSAAFIQAIEAAMILRAVLDDGMLRLPFVGWLPVIPHALIPLFALVWCIAAIAFAAGWHYRIAGSVLALLMGYSIVLDQQTYSNHVWLLVIVVGIVSWAGSEAARLLRWQLSIVYFFAAVSKMNLIYVSGAIIGLNMRHGWLVPLPESLVRWELLMPLAIMSIVLELFLAFAFWSRRHRKAATIAGILFHITFVVLFPADVALGLIVFGCVMFAMFIAFHPGPIRLDLVSVPAFVPRPSNPSPVPALSSMPGVARLLRRRQRY